MYDSPHQFSPLVPSAIPAAIMDKAAGITQSGTRLSGFAHPASRTAIRELVRSMNSYYSNRIEDQSTHSLNIEKALRREFFDKPDVARLPLHALQFLFPELYPEAATKPD